MIWVFLKVKVLICTLSCVYAEKRWWCSRSSPEKWSLWEFANLRHLVVVVVDKDWRDGKSQLWLFYQTLVMSFAIPSGMCGDTTNNTSLKIATSETPYPTIWSYTRNTRFSVRLEERFYFFKVSEQYLHQTLIVLKKIVVYVSQLTSTFTKFKGVSPFRHTWTRTFYWASVWHTVCPLVVVDTFITPTHCIIDKT